MEVCAMFLLLTIGERIIMLLKIWMCYTKIKCNGNGFVRDAT